MKDTDDKAAFGFAAAIGVPWILVGVIETGLIPSSSGTSIAVLALASFAALAAWGLGSLRSIRAYAHGDTAAWTSRGR